jgi:hypothetical protein
MAKTPSPWAKSQVEGAERLILTGRGRAEAAKLTVGEAYVWPALLMAQKTGEIDPNQMKVDLKLSEAAVRDVLEQMVDQGLISKPAWFE